MTSLTSKVLDTKKKKTKQSTTNHDKQNITISEK